MDVQDPQVAQVLEDVRRRVRERHAMGAGAEATEANEQAISDIKLGAHEATLHAVVNAHLAMPWTSPIDRVRVLVQRVVRRLLRWYINPIVEQQNAFNAPVARALSVMADEAARLRRDQGALAERLVRLESPAGGEERPITADGASAQRVTQIPSQPMNEELLAFFKLFSDVDRIKVAGLLAAQPSTVHDLAAQLGMSPAEVVRHVSYLEHAGLAAQHEGIWRFEDKALQAQARAIMSVAAPKSKLEVAGADTFDRKVLADFFGADGRLKALPAQPKKVQAVLRYVGRSFEPGKRYNEKEVNTILAQFNEDTASLRRGLVDYGIMARQAGVYRLTGE